MARLADTVEAGYLRGADPGAVGTMPSLPDHLWHPTPRTQQMASFLVEGGHRLSGRIRPAGNKNAALPCLAATVLATEPVTLDNVPRIRDVEVFLEIVASLGATVKLNGGFSISAPQLRGSDMFLDEPSVTGTENAIMAAVLAQGHTRIRNAAAEPHVQDLCHLLNAMGARIQGIGTGILEIEGVTSLGGARFTIGADHIETGSFIGLAAVTRSDLVIEGAPVEHLDSTLMGFRRLGVRCTIEGADLRVHGSEDHVIRQDAFGHVPKIDDGPWPAFPADLTSIALVTATQCTGTVLIHEKMFESRMYFTDKLVGLGASIILCDPHRAVVVGPSPLTAGVVESPDIRAGMALLIAALGAEGTSRIKNIRQIERGYEGIDDRLRALGARIERSE